MKKLVLKDELGNRVVIPEEYRDVVNRHINDDCQDCLSGLIDSLQNRNGINVDINLQKKSKSFEVGGQLIDNGDGKKAKRRVAKTLQNSVPFGYGRYSGIIDEQGREISNPTEIEAIRNNIKFMENNVPESYNTPYRNATMHHTVSPEWSKPLRVAAMGGPHHPITNPTGDKPKVTIPKAKTKAAQQPLIINSESTNVPKSLPIVKQPRDRIRALTPAEVTRMNNKPEEDTRSFMSDSRALDRGEKAWNTIRKGALAAQFAPHPVVRYPSMGLNTLMGAVDSYGSFKKGDDLNGTIDAIGALPVPGSKFFNRFIGPYSKGLSKPLKRIAGTALGINTFGVASEATNNFGLEEYAQGGQMINCPDCGHSWDYKDGGADPYTCHNCNSVVEMSFGGSMENEEGYPPNVPYSNPIELNLPVRKQPLGYKGTYGNFNLDAGFLNTNIGAYGGRKLSDKFQVDGGVNLNVNKYAATPTFNVGVKMKFADGGQPSLSKYYTGGPEDVAQNPNDDYDPFGVRKMLPKVGQNEFFKDTPGNYVQPISSHDQQKTWDGTNWVNPSAYRLENKVPVNGTPNIAPVVVPSPPTNFHADQEFEDGLSPDNPTKMEGSENYGDRTVVKPLSKPAEKKLLFGNISKFIKENPAEVATLGLGFLGNSLSPNTNDTEQAMVNGSSDSMYSTNAGSRGDWTVNEGYQRPDQKTLTQFSSNPYNRYGIPKAAMGLSTDLMQTAVATINNQIDLTPSLQIPVPTQEVEKVEAPVQQAAVVNTNFRPGQGIDLSSTGKDVATKNNNPGNMIFKSWMTSLGGKKSDMKQTDGDGYFASFPSVAEGLQAYQKQLFGDTDGIFQSNYYKADTPVDVALRKWSNDGYNANIFPELKNRTLGSLNQTERDELTKRQIKHESGNMYKAIYGNNAKTKKGVNVNNLNSSLQSFTNQMAQKFPGLVLSSGNDSKHMKGSKHYSNKAIDIGANSSNKSDYANFKAYLKANPGIKKQYGIEDILDEGDHIHIEQMEEGGEYEMNEQQLQQFLRRGGVVEYI